jgi:hypothetical protein
MLVENSPKNSRFVQKETSSSITLKVNFTVILDVTFILMFKFNFILTCNFDIFKGKIRQYEKKKKSLNYFFKSQLIYTETLYK